MVSWAKPRPLVAVTFERVVRWRGLIAPVRRSAAERRLTAVLYLDEEAEKAKAAHIATQWRQVKGPAPSVTCECGNTIPLRFAFRCLYCGAFFCQSCAEVHFGKTREQYNAERLAKMQAERHNGGELCVTPDPSRGRSKRSLR